MVVEGSWADLIVVGGGFDAQCSSDKETDIVNDRDNDHNNENDVFLRYDRLGHKPDDVTTAYFRLGTQGSSL